MSIPRFVRAPALGLAALVALHGGSALAQARVSPGMQELQLYGGDRFGDSLLGTPPTGTIRLRDDSPTYGGRYTYDFTEQWGVQLSAGHSPSRAAYLASAGTNLGLTTIDLDVLWNIAPGFRLVNRVLYPYTAAGVGYAWAHFDRSLSAVVGMRTVSIAGGDGYTANIGLGVKYYLRSGLFVDFGVRYRYLSKLANHYEQGLNTGETTFGVGYQF